MVDRATTVIDAAPPHAVTARLRVVLLMSPATYRAGAFLAAAERLDLEVLKGIDLPPSLVSYWDVPLGFDFTHPEQAADQIVAALGDRPPVAILAVDDGATMVASLASDRLGLPSNDPRAALAARDKFVMRERLAAGGVPVPDYRRYPLTADPVGIAAETSYPCVIKPLRLSGSRGVIRADTPSEFIAAWVRARQLLIGEGYAPDGDESFLLVERYLPGVEVALEGLLTDGELQTLALFDKPDPLDGPFFEETLYVTPSRLTPEVQVAIASRTAQSAAALGLRDGPVHAELRINDEGVWLIEMAGRSIGGLCSRVLEFGVGVSLEELILRHAVGLPLPVMDQAATGAAVMMIPIPRAGMLRGVDGVDAASAVPGVSGVEITAKLNHPLVPLPEGASYLGFIFARGASPAAAEAALREAHARLHFRIEPTITLMTR